MKFRGVLPTNSAPCVCTAEKSENNEADTFEFPVRKKKTGRGFFAILLNLSI